MSTIIQTIRFSLKFVYHTMEGFFFSIQYLISHLDASVLSFAMENKLLNFSEIVSYLHMYMKHIHHLFAKMYILLVELKCSEASRVYVCNMRFNNHVTMLIQKTTYYVAENFKWGNTILKQYLERNLHYFSHKILLYYQKIFFIKYF